MKKQAEKAKLLRSLHQGPDILLLPNVWDCASARILEEAGFPAIATTSAGVAFAAGYPDGQRIPAKEMLAAVDRISRCVGIPVTADLESGYENVARTATALIEAGAVGLNLEDLERGGKKEKLLPIARQVRKIATVKQVGKRLGVSIVINARTDLYLEEIGETSSRFECACERLEAYRDAGADCLFIPGVSDEGLIRKFVERLKFPINILATAGSPTIPRLRELGVSRVSLGSWVMRAAMGATRRVVKNMKAHGTYDDLLLGAIPFGEANGLFEYVRK
ncbi:MAG: isocitrate lyase/PEP mutase family protein [Candidatus Acidiferrales bacterium]